MNLLESLRGALTSLKANKLRASLTMLGIIIGIAAVITVVTIGMGGKAAIMQELEKTGVNLFIIYPKSRTQNNSDGMKLTIQDVESLKRSLPQVKSLIPASSEYGNLEVNQKSASAIIAGTTPEFAEARRRQIAAGRFFTEDEMASNRRVVVIDQRVADTLFGAGNPLGQQVMIHNVPCRVIGVLAKDESVFTQFAPMEQQSSFGYMPWGTWSDIFGSRRIDQLEGTTYDKVDLEGTTNSARRILNQRHGTTDEYEVFNIQQLVDAADKITKILTSIIGLVAGISLLVGGIGIMNIMLVSVTERTREIGLRKAVGAKERDILMQFLLEATVISLIGGLIGIVLGSGSAVLITNLLKWPPLLSTWSIITAVTFSIAVGIFFGYYPARKAAKLEPMAALRYE